MVSSKDNRETHLPLLQDAQAYLKLLLENKVPNSLLAAAWDDFYRVYDDLIRRFASAQGVPRSDVDDCVQEVWSEVAIRLFDFNRPADRPGLRAWLYTMVRSKATNVYRGKARQPIVGLDEQQLRQSDRSSDPAALCEQLWERAALESIVSQLCEELSQTNSRLLQMRLLEQRTVDEVAAELHLEPAQIHARQHRLMKKLRARVALYTGGIIG